MPEAAALASAKERDDALAALHFHAALAFSNCAQRERAKDELRAFFRLHPGRSSLDEAKYDRAFIRLFDDVQRTLGTPELFDRFYPGFGASGDAAEEPLPLNLWSTSPAFQLMAGEDEREEWGRLRDDARVAFVERFWSRRDPGLRAETARRVAFADRVFDGPGELRGAMSDRGRVFVLLGPPAHVYRQGLQQYETTIVAPRTRTPLTGTLERWIYSGPRLSVSVQQVEFRFISQPGYGDGVMQRDFWPLKALAGARQARRNSEPSDPAR